MNGLRKALGNLCRISNKNTKNSTQLRKTTLTMVVYHLSHGASSTVFANATQKSLMIRFVQISNVPFTKAPAKRSPHANTTYCNIVGRNMLRAFGHCIATCCDVLSVVGSNLTIFKLEPTTTNMSQHIATRWPNARSMLRPTM